jgi:hypothetical protein
MVDAARRTRAAVHPHVAWDPIGVGDCSVAWDEYDQYLPGVARRLRDAADEDDAERSFGAYLDHIEKVWIGVDRHTSRQNRDLASILVEWHEWAFLRGGRPPREWKNDV